ncbi:putative disease resistance RPP13-like protein 1 [Cocos nucifera]|uniref:Putative disease resistance RPP13-like protein 1 n=1 Tax=Cocos nucifera TaxID=13894 RepID=A0A8K0N3P1_COCNU|nr:putative disease resistance RPP13-like protein 1 [Cocos nucifera]
MAMILDAFVSKFADLLVELVKEEVDMLLVVPGEIKKLQNNLRKIRKVLIDAERKRIDDEAVDDWLKELQDVMYDADDLLDLCLIEADKRSEGSSSNYLVRFSLPFFARIRKLPVDHEIGTKIRELNKRLEDGWRWRSELNLELTFPDMQPVTSQKGRVLGSTAWSTSGLPEEESLRTLMWPRSLMSEAQMDVVFNKFYRLRVVDMSYSKIQRLPDCLGNLIHLRYLNISQTKISVIPETIGNLRNLQRLDMSSTEISMIPESIGNLTNLRTLDIFRTKISVIPESIGNLRNLQFLEMCWCSNLSRLPNSIVNLHNLRSLNLFATKVVGMPAGLGSLQNLHTLHGFKQQGNRSEGWCTIEELRSLSCLTDLSIQKLECISSSSQARAAELSNKPMLSILKLRCTRDLQPSKEEMGRTEEVFEELHPPPSLEELWIEYYFGCEFPKWMAETSSSASIHFPNLRRLYLLGCRYSERFPPSRLLPNLEFLEICDSAASVIDVGPEFSVGTSSTSSGGRRAAVDTCYHAFPKLKSLWIWNMRNWQEWHWDKGTQAMPCLKELTLYKCPKLMSLPEGLLLHATSLTKLTIFDAGSLTTIENLLSLTTLKVKCCLNPEKVSDLPMLTTLDVNNCSKLEKFSNLPALTTLEVEACLKLEVLENLQSLKIMELIDYEMKSLPSCLLTGVQRDKKKRKRVHVALLEKLEIRCSIELIRKIWQRASPEWSTIQDMQQVHAYSWDRLRSVHVLYNKFPFRFTTNFNDTTASSSSDILSSSSGIGL